MQVKVSQSLEIILPILSHDDQVLADVDVARGAAVGDGAVGAHVGDDGGQGAQGEGQEHDAVGAQDLREKSPNL